ncbi:MAG: spoIIIE [Verrucomicrobia bacterium]|nr:spoIIIE [Verrucomicrobiota bacterium]
MPKSETSNPNDGPSFKAQRYRPNWPEAVTCFILGTFITVALIDYDPAQVTIRSTAPATATNLMGWIGANTVWVLLFAVGVSTWLVPIFLFWMLYVAMRNARHLIITRVIAMIVASVALAGIAAMVKEAKWGNEYFPNGPGGISGLYIYHRVLADAIGGFGSGLLLGTCYVFALMFIFTKDIGLELERYLAMFQAWRAARRARKAGAAEQARKDKEAAARVKATAPAPVVAAVEVAKAAQVGPTGKKVFVPKAADETAKKDAEASATTAQKTQSPFAKPEAAAAAAKAAAEAKPAKKLELNIVKPEETKKAKTAPIPVLRDDDKNYEFPPLSLLKEQVKPTSANSEDEHRQNAENLLRILSEFGVEVTLGEIHVGPVITRYEVVPAAGVRVEKIAGLDKNIALGMRAQSVRILAPIPGKAAVGVEVPNQHPMAVGMREILESEDWSSAKAELPIALGKDVSGKPLISDLTKMPHLLIAGATGSGKSVCINSIVASILYSASPKNVRLIMVDPKVVELKIFNSLPHMLIPVVTEPKKVPAALKWLLGEMEQRYQIFAKVNVRNIVGFNTRKKGEPLSPADQAQAALSGVDPANEEIEIPERLPYIVAIIDELADLMMIAPAEIETSIARLAQLARAAGIHLIIATQRPSVNVITGVIKANLPSRIAFQVASQVDSRTILDTKGADTLIGRGDMLFSPPGTSRLVRAQGAFVADDEVTAIVEFLKKNGPPQYAQAVQQQIDRAAKEDDEEGGEGGDDGDMGDDEELYAQAIDVLKSTKRASTSMLQRRLRIGYNRAARIMDLMEQKGVVGPENGSSPREILVDLDAL